MFHRLRQRRLLLGAALIPGWAGAFLLAVCLNCLGVGEVEAAAPAAGIAHADVPCDHAGCDPAEAGSCHADGAACTSCGDAAASTDLQQLFQSPAALPADGAFYLVPAGRHRTATLEIAADLPGSGPPLHLSHCIFLI